MCMAAWLEAFDASMLVERKGCSVKRGTEGNYMKFSAKIDFLSLLYAYYIWTQSQNMMCISLDKQKPVYVPYSLVFKKKTEAMY